MKRRSSKIEKFPEGRMEPESNVLKKYDDKFKPLNTLLWMHGFGFTMKFQKTRKYIMHVSASVVLLLICQTSLLCSLVSSRIISDVDNDGIDRDFIIIECVRLLESILRILIHLKRDKLNGLESSMDKLYQSVSDNGLRKYKLLLSLVLISNDIFTILITVVYFASSDQRQRVPLAENLGIIPPSHSAAFFHIVTALGEWSSMTYIIPYHFCYLCYVLKEIMQQLKKKILKAKKLGPNYLRQIYTEIFTTVSAMNQIFHTMLLLTCAVLLGRTFYNSYVLMNRSTSKLLYRSFTIVISFIRFVLMCCFASSVAAAASELKEAIYDLPLSASQRWKNLQFILKLKETFVGFKLLDSLVIDRNLILSATGSLLTYGIIIATFNINSPIK